MGRIQRCLLLSMVTFAILGGNSVTQASIGLHIQISNFKFKYDAQQNGSLFDRNSIRGGSGAIPDATQVGNIDFYLGTEKITTLPSSEGLYCDFLVDGIYDILKTGGSTVTSNSTGPSFGFDLISSTQGRFVSLSLDSATVSYSPLQGTMRFSFTAVAAAGLLSQALPMGMHFGADFPITVTMSSGSLFSPTYDSDGDHFKSFWALGTADVFGTQAPEPAGSFLALLTLGVIGLQVRAYRRRAQR